MNEKIMIVDDEKEIADLLELYLNSNGYSIVKFNDGTSALQYLTEYQIDFALLDVMLPDIDGFTLLKKIREKYFFPVIMLTARIEDNDKILGLSLGADDYITKPFNPLELVARVKTQLRRCSQYNSFRANADVYEYRGLELNLSSHSCHLYEKEIQLTPIEFSIISYLLANKGKVISSEELFEAGWKEKYFDSNNTVMAHIARLREKLDDTAKKHKFIQTVWGVGYTIEKE